MENNKV